MDQLNTLLAILMSFLTIGGTLASIATFVFKFGTTFKLTLQDLTHSIGKLNEHLTRVENQTFKNDERLDNHEIRIVKLEKREEIENEN